jgi:hypothetical protein
VNVVIHTPRLLVEEWDIPLLAPGAADRAILATVRGQELGVAARRLSQVTLDTGPPYVHSRGPGELSAAGRRIAEARAAERAAIDEALAIAAREIGAGASERQVAAELGIDRNTLRSWLGKPRSA